MWRRVGWAVVVVGVAAGCAGVDEPGSEPTVSPVSSVSTTGVPQHTLDPAQQRNERIRGMLYTLGCTSNSCVQTYFACMDGYLTGEPCQFYRENPPPPP